MFVKMSLGSENRVEGWDKFPDAKQGSSIKQWMNRCRVKLHELDDDILEEVRFMIDSYFRRYAIKTSVSDLERYSFSYDLVSVPELARIFESGNCGQDDNPTVEDECYRTFDFRGVVGNHPHPVRLHEVTLIRELLKAGIEVYFDTRTSCFITPHLIASKPICGIGVTPMERYGRPLLSVKHSKPALKLFEDACLKGSFQTLDEVMVHMPRPFSHFLVDENFPWFGDMDDVEKVIPSWGSMVSEPDKMILRKLFGQTTKGSVPSKVRSDTRAFPTAFKMSLWASERDHLCGICGKPILSFEDCEVDHIIPYSKGGLTTPDNAQLTHQKCNRQKRDKIL